MAPGAQLGSEIEAPQDAGVMVIVLGPAHHERRQVDYYIAYEDPNLGRTISSAAEDPRRGSHSRLRRNGMDRAEVAVRRLPPWQTLIQAEDVPLAVLEPGGLAHVAH